MENEAKEPEKIIGEMCKRTETMPDGKRYIIYYTFADAEKEPQIEVKENV